jgi:hypothetical protein
MLIIQKIAEVGFRTSEVNYHKFAGELCSWRVLCMYKMHKVAGQGLVFYKCSSCVRT